ncbi:glycosyltransferase [Diaphorobacter sp. HDW4B]|uniref:glycosyltransferase n=1 Tax=Diaphorobacter sp. HDW4B TaxID=2714925 RepID=UPI00140A52CA|nr:glycosyltransferase [Diaphorobacter sp. HDW4B]QIL73223.1 glycosyltransferase [Diaphorobacter sp. HDW4B]
MNIEDGHPRLTVSIVTRNSQRHLAQVIAHARTYAHEIVVGVDASSVDNTWEVASALADRAYRFTHPNQLAAAHNFALRHCTGDWILRLDDDEFMEHGFKDILPNLMRNPSLTHYWFPRKWVVSENPPQYLHASPWFPNHALRMFRNDRSLIWKPPRYHTGYWVAGPGATESRVAILHYEPLWCDPADRARKVAIYREGGGNGAAEEFYGNPVGELRSFTPVDAPPPPTPLNPWIDPQVHPLQVAQWPEWGCRFDALDVPERARPGQYLPVAIHLSNTGAMTWWRSATSWPSLSVAYRLVTDGPPLPEGHRTPITGTIRPGETTSLTGTIQAPNAPGNYTLEWDVVSEWECWFVQCGSTPMRTYLSVQPYGLFT